MGAPARFSVRLGRRLVEDTIRSARVVRSGQTLAEPPLKVYRLDAELLGMTPTTAAVLAFLTACLPLVLTIINRRSIVKVQADPALGRPASGPGSSVIVPEVTPSSVGGQGEQNPSGQVPSTPAPAWTAARAA